MHQTRAASLAAARPVTDRYTTRRSRTPEAKRPKERDDRKAPRRADVVWTAGDPCHERATLGGMGAFLS